MNRKAVNFTAPICAIRWNYPGQSSRFGTTWERKDFSVATRSAPRKPLRNDFQIFRLVTPVARIECSRNDNAWGVNVCARTAEKLLKLDQVGIVDTTVNPLLLHLPEPGQSTVRVLGGDDRAKRKGQRYGTILVDLERRRIFDLLGERTAGPLVKCLKITQESSV